MPHEWGGPEMSMPDQLRLFERLSHADPAVGWCVMIGSDAGYFSSFLDDAAGRELWPDLDMVTAGWVTPAGHARRVDGGFIVDGRWSFGSGCTHADVLIGGCVVLDRTGELEIDAERLPSTRIVIAPAERFVILDTWHTTGLAGSGSNDFTCQHLFVPEEHTFPLATRSTARTDVPLPGCVHHEVPRSRAGARPPSTRRSDQDRREQGPHATDGPNARHATRPRRAREAETQFRAAARLQPRGRRSDVANAARRPPSQRRRTHRHDPVQSPRRSAWRERSPCRWCSSQAPKPIYTTSVLDQLVRDAITIAQHVVAGPMMIETAGAMTLGIQPAGPLAPII